MNVLIINSNRNRRPVSVMPLGACLVAEAARAAGHTVRFLDFMFAKNPLRMLQAELESFSPDVAGISLRNIDNNDIVGTANFFEELAPAVRLIREESNAEIVLGGAAVSVMPEALLRYFGIATAVTGNGAQVFPRLLAALEKGEDPGGIPGTARIVDGSYLQNAQSVNSSRECALPDFRAWINVDRYLGQLSTVPFQTKRGCPFSCVYCTYASCEGKEYILCTPESVGEQVKKAVAAGMRDIEFVDNVFNAPYDHAMALCETLARAETGARLQSVELNPRFIDDALLHAMERAGFVGIGVTAESASDRVLAALGKGFTARHVRRAAECVARHSLPCFWIFLLGGPGETMESVKETLRFAREHVRPGDNAFFNVGIRVYPGTKIEAIARKEEVLTAPAQEMLSASWYVSPEIDLEWLLDTVREATKARMNFIGPDSFRIRFLPGLFRIGRFFGMKHPLWRYTSAMRRGLRLLGARV